jgi:N6-adenosine-specific RNA methylase IME4
MTIKPKIDPEFRGLIPPLSTDERAQLEANLQRDGCRDALVVWNGVLLDGHNRLVICEQHHIPYTTRAIILADRLAARIWIRTLQLGRRNITDDMRAIIVAKLVADLAAQSKRLRASSAASARHAKLGSSGVHVAPEQKKKSRVRSTTAKRAGVSEHKVRQAQRLLARAPALADQVASGEIKLTDAVRKTRPAARAAKLAAAVWPDGKFGVILADPPWRPEIPGVMPPNRRIENQYPTLDLDGLIAHRTHVDALALPDCVLLLWTLPAKLGEAVRLVEAWGFTVKSGAVWIKPSVGMGYWFRQRHELLLLATRGAPDAPLEADRPDSVIEHARQRHSQKPDVVYTLIERMFPAVPKVEIYARGQRPGWAYATNEAELRRA